MKMSIFDEKSDIEWRFSTADHFLRNAATILLTFLHNLYILE